jgi:BASS family bile acid:Na+ symporter
LIQKVLAFIGRRSMPLLAAGILIGLAVPPLAALMRPLTAPLLFLLTAATLLKIEPRAVLAELRRPARLVAVLVWTMALQPVLMAAAVAPLGLPAGLVEALVLWSAASPLISAPALAFLLGLEAPLALVGMTLGTLAMPFTLPPLALALLGLQLEIGVGELMARLGVFVGGALLVALLARRLIGPARVDRAGLEISGLAVLFLLLFGIGVMDGVQTIFAEQPHEVLLFAAAAFAATIFMLTSTALVFAWLGLRPALSIALVGGYKNMAVVWAGLGAAASAEVTLYFVVIQLPIYLLPPVLKPLVRALTVTETKR